MNTSYNYIIRNIDLIVKLCQTGIINHKVLRNIEIYEYMIATNVEETSLKYSLSKRQVYTIKNQMETKV